MSGESHARFTGAVSFPNPSDARNFVTVINAFLESSAKVFFEIEKNPMYHLTALGDAKALASACENFEANAVYFELKDSQQRCRAAHEELVGHVREMERVSLETRPAVNKWSLAQADRLALCVKGILGCVKNLIDFNENDVICVTAQNIRLCHTATDALEKATSHRDKHKSNFTNVTDALVEQVANRADVLEARQSKDAKDQQAERELANTVARLRTLHRKLLPQIDVVLNRGTSRDFEEMRALLKEAADLFIPLLSEGDFSYKDLDSKAFNSAIDDLLNSIQRSSGPDIRDNASRVANQAKALSDAGRELKEQTKKLVSAAADALKNKDSEDAQKRLESLMEQTKKQAEELAERQRRENERRQQLLKASAGVGLAIESMQGNLGSYRDHVRHEMTHDLENAMDRDENERLRKLGK